MLFINNIHIRFTLPLVLDVTLEIGKKTKPVNFELFANGLTLLNFPRLTIV